jgi:hypothetical protein
MEIQLTAPTEVVAQRQVMKTISSITIHSIIDISSFEKTVTAHTAEFGPVLLWGGDSYDAIGQWTDSDVQARLFELFNLA